MTIFEGTKSAREVSLRCIQLLILADPTATGPQEHDALTEAAGRLLIPRFALEPRKLWKETADTSSHPSNKFQLDHLTDKDNMSWMFWHFFGVLGSQCLETVALQS